MKKGYVAFNRPSRSITRERGTIMEVFKEYLTAIGWAVTGAVSMAVALAILLRVFAWITPLNEWEEIRNGNLSVGIVVGSVIIAFAIVVAAVLAPVIR